MFNDDLKKQARQLVINDSKPELKEEYLPNNEVQEMPDDAKALWDAAWEKELERREGTLDENDRKYESARLNIILNKEGQLREEIVIGQYYWQDGVRHEKLNALGYDRLPPDVQEQLGKREDVVDQWIINDSKDLELRDAFVTYAHHNNEGYGTWEEYRDAKGLGSKEIKSIKNVPEANDIASPRETPTIPKDNTIEIS